MPVKAYTGLPRNGKSYEVVSNVILPALRQKRRVVSNIAGLNYDAMCQLLFAEGYSPDQIGTLVSVTHKQVKEPNFWRTDEDPDDFETFIQLGDLLALDEIWRFFKKRGEINPRAMNFFRMHGHMPHPETGLICEIALIAQGIKDFNENIRTVVEETYLMEKNTKVGSDDSYIVHIFQRDSVAKKDLIRTLAPRKYNPIYFPLYKSHSKKVEGAADVQEQNPDKRGNILQGFLFRIAIPLFAVLLLSSVFFVWRFFHPKNAESEVTTSQPAQIKASEQAPIAQSEPEVNVSWRVVGAYNSGAVITFIIQSNTGEVRQLINPPNFQQLGYGYSVELPEGGFATSWTRFNQDKGLI